MIVFSQTLNQKTYWLQYFFFTINNINIFNTITVTKKDKSYILI